MLQCILRLFFGASGEAIRGTQKDLCLSKHFIKALYTSTLSKHFTQALYPSTLNKHFIQTLYTSTLSKHFKQALYQSTLQRYYDKVLQRYYDKVLRQGITKVSRQGITTRYYDIFVQPSYRGRGICLLYTSPSPRDGLLSRMPSSA